MKKYNLLKVLAITVFVCWLLTLFIPGSGLNYSGEIKKTDIVGLGIFGIFSNLNMSLSIFSDITIFLISVACFYAVLNKTKGYQNLVLSISKKLEGNQSLLVIITTIIFGILSIFINDFLALIIFVPFIYKLMEKLEIDKKTMLASTLVAALIGSMCRIHHSTLFKLFDLKINTLLLMRLILFVLSISVLLTLIVPKNVINKKVSNKAESKKEVSKKVQKGRKASKATYSIITILFGTFGVNKFYAGNIKQGILRILFCWTLIPTILSVAEFITLLTEKADENGKIEIISERRNKVSFIVLLTLFILFVISASIPWESLIHKLTVFTDFNTWLSNLKIGGYAIFNNIIGSPVVIDSTYNTSTGIIPAFGTWQLIDLAILLFVLTAVMAFSENIKFDEFISTVTSGVKNILPIAITAMLVSIVLAIMLNTAVNITIVNAILNLANGFNIATSFVGSLIGSLLTTHFDAMLSTVGLVFTSVITKKEYYGILAFIIQSAYNFVLIFAPTSVGLVIGLYYLNIPYNKWLKFIWKLLIALFVIIMVMSAIIYALI